MEELLCYLCLSSSTFKRYPISFYVVLAFFQTQLQYLWNGMSRVCVLQFLLLLQQQSLWPKRSTGKEEVYGISRESSSSLFFCVVVFNCKSFSPDGLSLSFQKERNETGSNFLSSKLQGNHLISPISLLSAFSLLDVTYYISTSHKLEFPPQIPLMMSLSRIFSNVGSEGL